LSEEAVDRRLRERGIGDLRWYSGEMHAASFALPAFLRHRIARAAVPVSGCSARLDVDPELATSASTTGEPTVRLTHVNAHEMASGSVDRP
jgi:hypothetical protein